MATQVTKVYNSAGGAGVDFTDGGSAAAYVNGLDLLALDQNVNIQVVGSMDFPSYFSFGPLTFDDTHKVTWTPAPGQNVNQLYPFGTALNEGASGAQLRFIHGREQYAKMGQVFRDLRIQFFHTDPGAALTTSGTSPFLSEWDVEFHNCRFHDVGTVATTGMLVGNSNCRTLIQNCLAIAEGAQHTLFAQQSAGSKLHRSTLVARGAGLGAPYACGIAGGDSLVFIGFGLNASGGYATTNSFANTPQDSGGVTVVTGANALVVNDTNDFRPKAGGPLINAGGVAARDTNDILGSYRGQVPDAGAYQLAAQTALPPVVATLRTVAISGRRVTVTADLSAEASSGTISLAFAATPNTAAVSKPAVIEGLVASAVFDLTAPGDYDIAKVIMQNSAGPGTSTGGAAFTVIAPPVPTATITSVTKSGRDVFINGTYTGIYPNEPISGTVTLTAGGSGAVTKTVAAVLHPNGTFSGRVPGNPYGEYSQTSVAITNYSGTGTDTDMGVSLPSPAYAVGDVLTDVSFKNETAGVQTDVPVSFGQLFIEGHLPASGAAVSLKAPDGSIVPCQLDIHSTNSDASVRHVQLSAILPSLPASATVKYDIIRAASGPAGSALTPASFAGLDASISLIETGADVAGPNPGPEYTAACAALLAAGTYITHLSGPICSEFIVAPQLKTAANAVNPDLNARFGIRIWAGQTKARIRFIVENCWAKKKSPLPGAGNIVFDAVSINSKVYRVSLKAGTTTVYTRAVNGYHAAGLGNGDLWGNNPTGLANDTTVYTATATIDGVAKPLTITGSAAQTYSSLESLIDNQIGAAGNCVMDVEQKALVIKSATTGPNSTVVISYGTLFPALNHVQFYRPIVGDEVIQHGKSHWKKTFWQGGTEPAVHIIHNKNYLTSTRGLPNYPPELIGSPAEIARVKNELLANEDIGRNGITKAVMQGVGASPGIGIFPEWAAQWLVSQNADAKYIMLKQADLAGSWPMFVRDQVTDKPIAFEDYPYATFSPNAGDAINPATGFSEKIPDNPVTSTLFKNSNQPDVSHHPDFYTLPWIITGDYDYMEGLAFHQRFLVLNANSHPSYRDGKKALFKGEQTRGQAWQLRTTLHARHFLRDDYPLRQEMADQLGYNLAFYDVGYADPNGPYHNELGVVWHPGYNLVGGSSLGPNTVAMTFMDDFFTAVAGRAVELGYSEWMPFFSFKAKYVIGRLTSPGFCYEWAAHEGLAVTSVPNTTNKADIFKTFAEVYNAFGPTQTSIQCGSDAMRQYRLPMEGSRNAIGYIGWYPDGHTGYAANLQPALSYAVTFGVLGAEDAQLVFENRTLKPDYNLGPQFSIAPYSIEGGEPVEPPAPTAPGKPYNVTATAGNGTVSVTGDVYNGGSAITNYYVVASTGQTANSATLPMSITMPNGVAATLQLRADNAVGQGTLSDPSNSVTPSAGVQTPTVTSVTLTPATTIMAVATTQQFAWQVFGTNSPSQAVNLSATAGTIDSSGLFTRPERTNVLQIIIITATSVFDPSKSATATVTILALPITDERLAMAKLDTTQFINLLPMSATGKRSLTTLFDSLITDIKTLRDSHNALVAKLDADAGVTATDYAATTSVPDSTVILGK